MDSLEFRNLTFNQLEWFKMHVFNGVGSAHFFVNPRDFIFKNAALIHDFKYYRGGTEEDRKKADKEFLENAIDAVRDQPRFKQFFYRCIAFVYYWVLKGLGKYSWEYYNKPATNWVDFVKRIKTYYVNSNQDYPTWLKHAESIV